MRKVSSGGFLHALWRILIYFSFFEASVMLQGFGRGKHELVTKNVRHLLIYFSIGG